MADYLSLLGQCEDLYAGVCFEPEAWLDSSLSDWIEGVAQSMPAEKVVAREVRRVVRVAQKLRRFWLDPPPGIPPDHGDWRARVDIGLGVAAWRPLLAIARHALDESPQPELFEDVKARFRVVTGERWMEGVEYEGWLEMPR